MKLPLWVYDYWQKKYVRFPFELLTTLPDGSRGFVFDGSPEQQNLINRWGHLFMRALEDQETTPVQATRSVFWVTLWVYRLRERRSPTKSKEPQSKGPRWYSEENHQIKKYKRTRR